jgi:hypothetical protein
MADAHSDAKQGKRFLEERRLVASSQQLTPVTLGIGGLSALVLGMGAYGRWLSQPPAEWATAELALGLVGAIYFAWQLSREGVAIRVGDAGVAIERGSEVVRLLWCDMKRIAVEKDLLVMSGTGPALSISTTTHALAVSWILKEAAERLPSLIDVAPKFVDSLPKPGDKDGLVDHVLSLQTTGRRCAKTRKVIKYERDARLCSVCTQVYLKEEIPDICLTCKHSLGGRAVVP